MNLNKQISKLHYISQESAGKTHLSAIADALNAGCKWIQLRVKNRSKSDVLRLATEAGVLCAKYGAKLIVNDYPEIAAQSNAYGLHLGLLDMSIPEARGIVGSKMVMGGTANTFAHICQRVNEGADYIGLGPFRFTTTKENLSPILGIEGFSRVMEQVHNAGITIPIIAIGGITAKDIPGLLETGVFGVALSGAITHADDPGREFTLIHNLLHSDFIHEN